MFQRPDGFYTKFEIVQRLGIAEREFDRYAATVQPVQREVLPGVLVKLYPLHEIARAVWRENLWKKG
jgi:hypothetical protein